ncbi:SNF1-related protein kinase regulatory subunit gamma-1, partial [Linum perenne]
NNLCDPVQRALRTRVSHGRIPRISSPPVFAVNREKMISFSGQNRESKKKKKKTKKQRKMQEPKKVMEVGREDDGIKNPEGESIVDSNFITDLKQKQHIHDQNQLDSGTALQTFLDHIPINAIPGIHNSSSVMEVKAGDSVRDAIDMLYKKNVLGAPIADFIDPENMSGRVSDRYMGFIDFSRMLLWCIHKCDKSHNNQSTINVVDSFFTMLHHNPDIAETKVGELAKSFLWDPFFPVHLEDTLFHVLLLLCKHQLQVVPVVEKSELQVIGFVTQNAVIQLLLQSTGLEWFDAIADKPLSEYREEHLTSVYGDQRLSEALNLLWESQIGVVAVVSRENKSVVGCIRNSDAYLLVENTNLFTNRKSITAGEFIHTESAESATDGDPTIQRDLGALLSAGTLKLKNAFLPKMDSVVTNKRSDTLKQAMVEMAKTNSNFSFLVDGSNRPTGILTSRDVIVQFAPPCMDSSFQGGGFFDFALEQAGCQEKNGTVICNRKASSSTRLVKATDTAESSN